MISSLGDVRIGRGMVALLALAAGQAAAMAVASGAESERRASAVDGAGSKQAQVERRVSVFRLRGTDRVRLLSSPREVGGRDDLYVFAAEGGEGTFGLPRLQMLGPIGGDLAFGRPAEVASGGRTGGQVTQLGTQASGGGGGGSGIASAGSGGGGGGSSSAGGGGSGGGGGGAGIFGTPGSLTDDFFVSMPPLGSSEQDTLNGGNNTDRFGTGGGSNDDDDGDDRDDDDGLGNGDDSDDQDDGDNDSDADGGSDFSAPVLQPGNGFRGETAPPPAIGDPKMPGYEAKAIARWDVVPFQSFGGQPGRDDDIFEIGVVAFHMSGIDRVEFSVDGGRWVSVEEMTKNPRTGVHEYWVKLDASLFKDSGPIEVRAIVRPNVGRSRVLAGDIFDRDRAGYDANIGEYALPLEVGDESAAPTEVYVSGSGSNTSGDGSLSRPYATIKKAAMEIFTGNDNDASGGIIRLLPGRYDFPGNGAGDVVSTSTSWLKITRAPGVSMGDVNLVDSVGRFAPRNGVPMLIHVSGVQVVPDRSKGGNMVFDGFSGRNSMLWIDNSMLIGKGKHEGDQFTTGWDAVFMTRVDQGHSHNGQSAELIRDSHIHNLLSDALTASDMIINTAVSEIDRDDTRAHPDVYQIRNNEFNQIAYGVTATKGIMAQGFFASDSGTGIRDIAFVNCVVDNSINSNGRKNMPHTFSFETTHHMVVKDCVFTGRPFGWNGTDGRGDADQDGMIDGTANVVVENSLFRKVDEATRAVTDIPGLPGPSAWVDEWIDNGGSPFDAWVEQTHLLPWQSSLTGVIYRAGPR